MSMETDIVTALTASLGAAVQGVCDGDLPQDALRPWVTFNRIDTPRRQALGAGSPVISSKPRFQFDVWADTQASRDTVMALLVPAVLALPHGVTLATQGARKHPATGLWWAWLDAQVNHAGA